ncbi:SAVED domain-containing protein [Actinocorallia sp. API 0066]|uniref:SAVED domain-containing protein n=1 Tax=Actinocorallia sp. API 0066 TaxID=2896846 RepID=UPI001E51E8AC|nr:SAVED domain-containing protein [Actinocorallia sp. API 0066]MCD0449403.1 SAVED domain-containing protein [Actinocorallia sp. API 0066]
MVTAADVRRGVPAGVRSDEGAEAYSRARYPLTLKTAVQVPDAGPRAKELVDALVDETLTAATISERLSPDAFCINVIPTMELHLAFYFGARLGQTHAREIVVHAKNTTGGADAPYFPATALAVTETDAAPLVVGSLETLEGGDPTKAALALDLQARGDQFFAPVVQTCREQRVGTLLRLHSPTQLLTPDRDTFTGAVEQIYRAWRDAPLPVAARTGKCSVFLSGPAAIALALGARLAGADHGRWTAYSFNSANSTYEPFPPAVVPEITA